MTELSRDITLDHYDDFLVEHYYLLFFFIRTFCKSR